MGVNISPLNPVVHSQNILFYPTYLEITQKGLADDNFKSGIKNNVFHKSLPHRIFGVLEQRMRKRYERYVQVECLYFYLSSLLRIRAITALH